MENNSLVHPLQVSAKFCYFHSNGLTDSYAFFSFPSNGPGTAYGTLITLCNGKHIFKLNISFLHCLGFGTFGR